MTPIQANSLPESLEGKDIIGKAKTGSGKTAAFALPMLSKINPKFFGVQGLVLCPTRELATQVAEEIRRIARFQSNIKVLTLCGGSPFGPQKGSLEHGCHIVVGTPGRVKDHIRKETVDFSQLQTLVLDEADRMLDMGFQDDVEFIIESTPRNRQTLLFSATFQDKIEHLSSAIMRNALMVEIESEDVKLNISQKFFSTSKNTRENDIAHLLAHFKPKHAVIFCNTRQVVNDLSNDLRARGYSVLPLQGDMDQRQRDQTLVRFSNRSISLLVATDVAARGLDIDDLEMVINYELPRETDVYTHRIGRTGRAGKSGIAVSLLQDSEKYRLEGISSLENQVVRIDTVPEQRADDITEPAKPEMITLCLDAGKKLKIRPGDIVGAITNGTEITGDDLGKITIFPFVSYIAVKRSIAKRVISILENGRVKAKLVKVKSL